jgi:hypothetical protein
MYGYVICEYSKIRQYMPEFANTMAQLKSDMITKASAQWDPRTYGGLKAASDQFSESTIMPELFNGLETANQPLVTWSQTIAAGHTGHQTLMTGTAVGGSIYKDYMIGLAGLALLSKAPRISEIRLQIGDRKVARINIEEAFAYDKPALIWEQPFVIDEEEGFSLYAYVLCSGQIRIKLLGIEMNKIPNKLQVSNTGAALT